LSGRLVTVTLKVRRTWEDSKVPDRDDDAWLVVLHWDEFGGVNGITDLAGVHTQIKDLWEKTPAGGVREYRPTANPLARPEVKARASMADYRS
jgi:hypothetical protein